jgi:hypothetical protein
MGAGKDLTCLHSLGGVSCQADFVCQLVPVSVCLSWRKSLSFPPVFLQEGLIGSLSCLSTGPSRGLFRVHSRSPPAHCTLVFSFLFRCPGLGAEGGGGGRGGW